jgi:DNA repair ATPase RecN
LAQLASRIQAFVSYSSTDEPFAKVKGLIKDMIAKLEREAKEEATEKAYCDEQTAKTEEKQGEVSEDIQKLTVKIDSAAAKSTKLKEEVQELQAELAKLAKEQAEMDKIRAEFHANYVTSKEDLVVGVRGVREALDMMHNYYGGAASAASAAAMLQEGAKADQAFASFMQQPEAPQKHEKAEGAGGSIISILEVVESDFAVELTKVETEEMDQQTEYNKLTQQNSISKTKMLQDVKYKTQFFVGLDEDLSQMSADRDNANAELAAVNEYFGKLKDRCVAKPEKYSERQARRQAEISGLKQALETLLEDTALMQRNSKRHRGNSRAGILRGR